MNQFDALANLMEKYILLFQEMTEVEALKLEAGKSYSLELLEDCMKKEQAFILQTRGYDQKRLAILEELSCSGLSFKELLSRLPESECGRFHQLFDRLQQAYSEFKPVYDCAGDTLELNIHRLDTAIENINRQSSGVTYSQEGTIEPQKTRTFKNVSI